MLTEAFSYQLGDCGVVALKIRNILSSPLIGRGRNVSAETMQLKAIHRNNLIGMAIYASLIRRKKPRLPKG
jgi:hypothetical protein